MEQETKKKKFPRGQGSLIRLPGSKNWYSRYCVRGKEHVESTGTPDLKLAEKRHRQLLDEIALDRQGAKRFLPPAAQRVKVNELLDDLGVDFRLRGKATSWHQVECHVRPLQERFGHWRASDLTPEAVDGFIEDMLADGFAPATVNRSSELLRQAFRLGFERGKVSTVPKIRMLPETNVRQGFFEHPDFEAMVAALPDYLQDFCRFAYLTGWRRGELTSLKWSDVDRDGGAIRLRPEESKNGRGRTIVLDGELAPLMERRWQARLVDKGGTVRVVDWVFHCSGRPIGDFRKQWTSACAKAGLYVLIRDDSGKERKVPTKLFHDLRRTAARNMIRAGVPERVAMAVTGHLTRSMFDRYNIVSEDDLRAAMQKTSLYVENLPRNLNLENHDRGHLS